jgi:hypothetical protein
MIKFIDLIKTFNSKKYINRGNYKLLKYHICEKAIEETKIQQSR